MNRPRPHLTAKRILEEATRLIDAKGLQELSMRRLGSALGVEAMSLYNYFPSKEALLSAVVDHLLGEIAIPSPSHVWRQRVALGFGAFRALLLRHPNTIPLFAGPARWTDAGLQLAEELLVVLREGGLDDDDAFRAYRILISYTIGHAVVEVGIAVEAAESDSDRVSVKDAVRRVDPARFPEVSRMLEALSRQEAEDTFDLELRMILDAFATTSAQ